MNSYEGFRNIIREERENLTQLSDVWNTKINCDKTISKELEGRIRAAVGKTRLLLAEKFKQFEGLIDQSENNTSEKEISLNDLQGFWDLVSIQVNQVKEMFRALEGKLPSENRKLGKSKSREFENFENSKRENKSANGSRKKLSNDQLDQAEKKIKEIVNK